MIDPVLKDTAQIIAILAFVLGVGKWLFASGKQTGASDSSIRAAIELLETRIAGKLDNVQVTLTNVVARIDKLESAKIEQRVIALEERMRGKDA